MNSKKKWLIGVLVAVINTALILAYVGYRYYEYSKAEELVMAYESVAVSYTHLTLPTNSLV